MTADTIAIILKNFLVKSPDLKDSEICLPTSDPIDDKHNTLEISISSATEVIAGNYTYEIDGSVDCRFRYTENEANDLRQEAQIRTQSVFKVLTELDAQQGEDPCWFYIIQSRPSLPSLVKAEDGIMVYEVSFKIIIQF